MFDFPLIKFRNLNSSYCGISSTFNNMPFCLYKNLLPSLKKITHRRVWQILTISILPLSSSKASINNENAEYETCDIQVFIYITYIFTILFPVEFPIKPPSALKNNYKFSRIKKKTSLSDTSVLDCVTKFDKDEVAYLSIRWM